MTTYILTPEDLIAEIVRLRNACDCSCHWFWDVWHGGDCCPHSGMRRTEAGTYEPWPEPTGEEDPYWDEPAEDGHGPEGWW
jgi:hypothetical protein